MAVVVVLAVVRVVIAVVAVAVAVVEEGVSCTGLSPDWFFPKTNKTHGAGCTSQHAGHLGLSPMRFF